MSLSVIKRIEIPFKGKRDYLHSTDIFNAFVSIIPAYDSFQMFIFKKMTHALSFVPVPVTEDKNNYSAMIYYNFDGQEYAIGVKEDSAQAVITRKEFNEESAIRRNILALSDKTIRLTVENIHNTMIDCIVALNKRLLQSVISQEAKWAFTRLELQRPLLEGNIKIQLVKNIGVKLTKSAIFINDQSIGFIYFSEFSKAYQ